MESELIESIKDSKASAKAISIAKVWNILMESCMLNLSFITNVASLSY